MEKNLVTMIILFAYFLIKSHKHLTLIFIAKVQNPTLCLLYLK